MKLVLVGLAGHLPPSRNGIRNGGEIPHAQNAADKQNPFGNIPVFITPRHSTHRAS